MAMGARRPPLLLIAAALLLSAFAFSCASAARRDLFPGTTESKAVQSEASNAAEAEWKAALNGLGEAISSAADLGTGPGPMMCKALDCPSFKVLERCAHETELRRYEPASFTSTVVSLDETEGCIEKAGMIGFHRLLKYNWGDNDDGAHVPMSAPVLWGLDIDRKASSRHRVRWGDRFSVSFFVPYRYQDKPPEPSNPDVFLVHTRTNDIFVRSFDGYATGDRVQRITTGFLRDLHDAGHRFDCRTIFVAQYSPPFLPMFRFNEIWVLRSRRHSRKKDPTEELAAFADPAIYDPAEDDSNPDECDAADPDCVYDDEDACGAWMDADVADDGA